MTVKEQVRRELLLVALGAGHLSWAVIGGVAALFGRMEIAQVSWAVSAVCFVLLALGVFAVWANAQEPLVECSECHRLNEDRQLAHIGTNRKVCARCLHPTKWVA